ncbi:peptide deformylase [Sneathiella glossodoripedis]|uniref:peptide deformylase n=1 Tax=Sneathiella glossodoripedis TaxID=418853 RepID=UPI000471217B|nr:peptide deformylase [Sneathiella glossodoripedis]
MPILNLPLVIAPDPIFRKKAEVVDKVDDEIRGHIHDMFETLYAANGLGLGANMVGLLKQIIVIDLKENGVSQPLAMVNPEILQSSDSMQVYNEASLSFPGISADIKRPDQITVRYLDEPGDEQTLKADGFLATVIQHEMDYLQGRTFLDHLSRTKRDTLMRKYLKSRRAAG